jgi:trehalose-6-phosphatase
MYICVDFDGTIVDHRYPSIGQPAPGAIHWLNDWIKAGGRIVLFTMRSGAPLDDAVAFIRAQGISLHGINHNPDQASWSSSPKAYAHIYIDDAAFGCPMILPEGFNRSCVDWAVVGPAVRKAIDLHKARAT